MADPDRRLTVLQAKFAAYLSWSQPFLHTLISRLDEHVRNVILCNRTENLDRFPVRHVERLPTRYLVQPRLAVMAASYLERTWHPDVMHGHFGWSGLRLVLQKQMLRIPLVVSFGGRDVGLQMHLPGWDRLYRTLLDASDAVICVSHDLADKALAGGADPDRLHVVHRGADLSGFAFEDRRERPTDRPLELLMVGRIVEKKGHRYALEALREARRAGAGLRLTIVGEGEGYHSLRRLRRQLGLRDAVELAGATDQAGVRRAMQRADALVHCSVTPESGDVEGIPNVLVEAQATGLPVVGTRHGGIPEAMRDGQTGILVAERSVPDLIAAFRRLADDPAGRHELGRGARAFVCESFDVTRQVERHVEIYRQVVERAASDPGWAKQVWVPEDLTALLERTVLAQRIEHPSEFSIAELIERLMWLRGFEEELSGGEVSRSGVFLPEASRLVAAPGAAIDGPAESEASAGESTLERVYNWKGLIPQSIKFPAKMTLGRALAWAIERRNRRHHGEALEALERADREALDFFRGGGNLHDWEARGRRFAGPGSDREAGA